MNKFLNIALMVLIVLARFSLKTLAFAVSLTFTLVKFALVMFLILFSLGRISTADYY